MYSYHLFYFPFKWDILAKGGESSFSDRIDLNAIRVDENSSWEHVADNRNETDYLLYNEKNYFYSFVHPMLYDTGRPDTVMRHFERKEVKRGGVTYQIALASGEIYSLAVEELVLNLYSTGVGVLVFHLRNDAYRTPMDVLRINQLGRRIFPPFVGEANSVALPKQCSELADSISLIGLTGRADRYREDYTWYDSSDKAWDPARFIQSLTLDLTDDFVMIPYEGKRDLTSVATDRLRKGVVPAIDDRMFVSSLILDDELSEKIKESGWMSRDDFWIKYVLVDVNDSCVQNGDFRKNVLDRSSYLRWQGKGTSFGYSRYSFVSVTSRGYGEGLLLPHFKTLYSRLIEMVLIQRASVLKFSGEVTRLSNLREQDPHLADKIRDLYREYIRFVNQIYFREVTAQEQGIELYSALQDQVGLRKQVESLDDEIGELHQYATLLEDRNQNRQLNLITKIGGLFMIPSLIMGYFGMNIFEVSKNKDIASWFMLGLAIVLFSFAYIFFSCKHRLGRIIAWIILLTCVIGMFCLTYY